MGNLSYEHEGGSLGALDQVRVPEVAPHLEAERRALHGQDAAALEERLGDRVDVVVAGVGRVDDRELDLARHLHVVEGLPLLDRHLRVDLEHARDELAGEQEDEPGVDDPEAELLQRELEPLHLRGDEVHREDESDETAAREDRERPVGLRHVPPDDHGADVLVDGPERAELHRRVLAQVDPLGRVVEVRHDHVIAGDEARAAR